MSKQLWQYKVEADVNSGEWLGVPEFVGMADSAEWYAKQDTDTAHFDTYEELIKDETGRLTDDTETRAIEVLWTV